MAVTTIGTNTVDWMGGLSIFPAVSRLRRNRGHLFFLQSTQDVPANLYLNIFARYDVNGESIWSGLIDKYFPITEKVFVFIPVPEFTGDNNTPTEVILQPKGFFGVAGATFAPDITLFYDDDRAIGLSANTA